MARVVRAAGALAFLALTASFAPAAGQREIDAAIKRGSDFLKAQMRNGGGGNAQHGIGPAALAGIALIETRVPANDPTLIAVANAVRNASFTETKTYQLSLCLIFLDRLEDPSDVPLIQMLAVRLLIGQNAGGGWTYGCIDGVTQPEDEWLRKRLKTNQLVGGEGQASQPKEPDPKPAGNKLPTLHPDVKEYAAAIVNRKANRTLTDDNSNTQVAIIAVWAARKHGVPVEGALDLIEKRFLSSQDTEGGGWSYDYEGGLARPSTPAMTCAGLLGLSTGIARREERRTKVDPPAKEPTPKTPKSNDPFFTPAGRPDEKKTPGKRPELQSPAVMKAFGCLGNQLVQIVRGANGEHPLYTLWSIERVGVLYGVEKIGGIDWYEFGSDHLLKTQGANGSWGSEVDTSFALLFLCKANLARDLSNKFRNAKDNELRAGTSGATPSGGTGEAPMPKTPGSGANPGTKPLPAPVENESTKLANQLVLSPPTDWTKALEKIRDAKGGDHTTGLAIAISRLDGDRKKEAREALAERLTRMSAETLKSIMTGDDVELRRGAVLACAMKDDKVHVPDLIDRLTDDEDIVVRAAKAGLKSLTSQDFGPKNGATKEECKSAATAWRGWWAKQK